MVSPEKNAQGKDKAGAGKPTGQDPEHHGARIEIERLISPAATAFITLSGFLQRREARAVANTLESFRQEGISNIIFEMSGVQYANSSVVGAFVNCASIVKASGGQVVLLSMRPNMETVLQTLGLAGLFTIVNSKEDALKAVS